MTTTSGAIPIDGEFTFTVHADDMIAALRGVSQFASTDSTLPAICGVQAELADEELTLAATDRYTVGYQVVKPDKTEGAGSLFLPTSVVKSFIARETAAKYDVWTFTVGSGSWTLETLSGEKQTHPDAGVTFPRWRTLVDRFEPLPPEDRAESVAFSSKLLAKLTKIPGSLSVQFDLAASGKPVRFTAGDVAGLIIPMRSA